MTKVKQGIESFLSGKFGNMVFVQRQGKTYVRRAPQRKKDSSTPAMLLNQQRFARIMSFCGLFKNTIIPRVWTVAADGSSGFRLFQKVNSPAFAPDGTLSDVSKVQMSTGNLTLPQGLKVSRKAAGSSAVNVSWDVDAELGGIHLKDELLAVSAGDGKYSDIVDTSITRGTLGGTIELPGDPYPATHIFLFFGSRDGKDYSPSMCFQI
ncbi:MAG TPA: hypothetical protein VFG54_07380 [Prolixibacteraceae bacterium]|nr:hypothetical protein [Prolixibacteraceae bacterium]